MRFPVTARDLRRLQAAGLDHESWRDGQRSSGCGYAPLAIRRDDAEREHLRQALAQSGWRIRGSGGAAERLGISRKTLWQKLRQHGLMD